MQRKHKKMWHKERFPKFAVLLIQNLLGKLGEFEISSSSPN